jgi:acetyl esterase/lipase
MTVLDPQAQAIVDAAAVPPFLFQLPIETGRARLRDLQTGGATDERVVVNDVRLPVNDHDLSVRIVRPRGSDGLLPVVLYLHAGWAFGDVATHERLVNELADRVGAIVVFPSFSLSPEARYPTAINEIYSVAQWIHEEGRTLGFDAARVAIAGDSAGGNMATAVALMAKERGAPSFVHQILVYPTLDAAFDTPSYDEFATGYNIRRDHMQWLWDQYLPDVSLRSEVTASPLRAIVDELRGLPPATIITAEADVLRDDGEAYASKLRAAGVPVTAMRFLGTIHDFVMLNALRDTPAARAATAEMVRALHSAFDNAPEHAGARQQST